MSRADSSLSRAAARSRELEATHAARTAQDQAERDEAYEQLRLVEGWRYDPTGWAQHRGVHLWSKQRSIATSVVKNRATAVRSCHDAGKSFEAALLGCWWIDTRPPGDALVVSTAPSYSQVHAILWEEIRRLHRRLNLPGRVQLSDRWLLDEGTLVGLGQRPADYNPHSFQGYHRRYVLVIIDEACGVPAWLWTAVDAITTGEDCRILAIGNPDDPSAHFASLFKPDSGWAREHISAFDTPNLTGEQVPEELSPLLLSKSWVDEKRGQWGESSPVWQAKVLGEFPDLSDDAVIPLAWVRAAVKRWQDWDDAGRPDPLGRRILGVDVAGEGSDEACIAVRQGDVIIEIERNAQASRDTMALAGLVSARLSHPSYRAVVDMDGVGTGVVHKLREERKPVVPFVAGGRDAKMRDSTNEWQFKTRRAAAWWNMRELLDPARDSTICLPDDDKLIRDLTAPKWKPVSGGFLWVEPKAEVRKRIDRSTDTGDAVIQAFWLSAAPSSGEGALAEWDDMPSYDDDNEFEPRFLRRRRERMGTTAP